MDADNHEAGSDIEVEDTGAMPRTRLETLVARAAVCAVALAALAAAAAAHASDAAYKVGPGVPLKPGVYGRIDVHGAPPPLISPHPLVATRSIGPVVGEPLYFHVPAGQVRKWSLYCQRYAACDRPVYFVRVDDSAGKLGRWKSRERASNAGHATTLAAEADRRF